MSAEGSPDRPPPPPPPDPPKKQYEAAAVTDAGGGPPEDIVERHPADHQANAGSSDASTPRGESISGLGGSPEASAESLTRDQQLERWKQADAKQYTDQLNRATPEQIGDMREAAYKEYDATLERMQATALKNDPESDSAWREAYDRNRIAQQRLDLIGEHGGGSGPPDNGPRDPGSANGDSERPGKGDVKMSYIERLPVQRKNDVGIGAKEIPGTTRTAADVVGGNLERTRTVHDQGTVGKPEATLSVDRPTVKLDPKVTDVNAFRERVRDGDGPGAKIDLEDLPNCTACAKAVDARFAGDSTARAGYIDYRTLEQTAGPGREGVLPHLVEREWGRKISAVSDPLHPEDGDSWSKISKELTEGGSGTRGVLVFGGHVANVVNDNGELKVFDGQIGFEGSWSDYTKKTSELRDGRPGLTEKDVRGWIRTSPDASSADKPGEPGNTPIEGVSSQSSQAMADAKVEQAEQRVAESRQAEIGGEKSAVGAVETARGEARAEVIRAERDVGAADKEIRDIEDKPSPPDTADSRKLDELKTARAEASDRLDQNLTIESDPESAVTGGEVQEAERARAEAEQAERDAEEARKRQQNP